MEHQNILHLLNQARKWNFVNDKSNTNYDVEN